MKKWTVLVDMDEVLCDFISGACRIHGTTKDRLHEEVRPGTWDISGPLGTIIGRRLHPDAFWSPIHLAGEGFWTSLQPLPEAIHIVDLLTDLVGVDWYVVSAPSRCHSSHTGKIKWLRNWLGAEFDRFVLTPHKYLFAKENVILIDDRDENVEKFRAAGGVGIVYPTIGNSLHEHRNNALDNLADTLQSVLGTNYGTP